MPAIAYLEPFMPSPFPGMNPYLEDPGVWHDFHLAFAVMIRNDLVPQVRPDFYVTTDDHLYIHELPEGGRRLLGRSDLSVVEGRAEHRAATETTATLEAPHRGRLVVDADILREPFIEIRDRMSRQVVTEIEIISPTNKNPGSDREQFLAKRRELIASTVHYVEIDLLRGGPRMPIRDLPDCDSYAMVSRYEERPEVGLWPVSLRESLPTIPIPLKSGYRDVRLDLQAILHQTYDGAGYADYIYVNEPKPPLSDENARWAEELIAGGV